MNVKKTFLLNQAQITQSPIGLEVSHAKDIYIYNKKGEKYTDLIAGVSACTLGHSNPSIIKAINKQLEKYTHVMVYGEYIQDPQVKLANELAKNLPKKFQQCCSSSMINYCIFDKLNPSTRISYSITELNVLSMS